MHSAAAKPRRAHRYEIRTDIRFRPLAVQDWRFGETENISDTGILVCAPEVLPVDTPIQLEMYAPAPISGTAGLPLTCSGRVVRSIQPSAGNRTVRLAIEVISAELQGFDASPTARQQDRRLAETCHTITNQLAVVVGTTELLLANDALDDSIATRLRKIKDVSLQAATTVKKLLA